MNSEYGVKDATNHVSLILTDMTEDILIPLIVFSALFGIIFVFVSARNRERMAMIEKGVSPKDFLSPAKTNTHGVLKWALLLVGLGFGLFIGSLLATYTTIQEEPAYFASALFFGGLGLFGAYMIAKRSDVEA